MAHGKEGFCHHGFFARYVRDMLACVASSGIDCNVGGMFINILAYADGVVLLAPSWCSEQARTLVAPSNHVMIDILRLFCFARERHKMLQKDICFICSRLTTLHIW